MQDSNSDQVQFFLTPKHPCSYLDRNNAQTLFFDPREVVSPQIYQNLTDQGFRRSGSHLYRPHCGSCRACVPTRVPVEQFTPRRSQKRVLKKNSDLHVRLEAATFSKRHYHLYERYISLRHTDGDMYPASEDQYRSFLLSPWSNSLFVCLYDGERLLSVAVTDEQPRGLSAIYTFFEPNEEARSLGVLSILKQIELCQELGLPYLYLGYWIKDCDKMNYKTQYRPTELFVNNRWVLMT
ncbi:bpt [Symbiodinium pilosum]|jgi:arginine-tRNA-protein transferase|uniref:arginyltransferase n=1 Tax=Symbiodinium pilosum TaxID=2952 RepID=A0A812NYX1_SYMPI|nr:arginyltransferase [Pseudomonadales bacterium]CAE7313381.1 bpt [Symbiodinium pilosum]